MAQKQVMARINLIIMKLKKGPASFDEIREYLKEKSKEIEYNLVVSQRTFQRDISDIRDAYNIDIVFDRSTKKYHIDADLNEEGNQYLLEAYDVINALNMSARVSKHIHFEKRKPKRTENIHGLLHAIENRRTINFRYYKFDENAFSTRKAEPYALKEFENRWYVIANDKSNNKVKCFALDRLYDLDFLDEKYTIPNDFNLEELYEYCYGIVSPTTGNPKRIVLHFTQHQGQYIKSLPLHHTQTILKDDKTGLLIELKVFATHDLFMKICSYGESCKVIEPPELVEWMKRSLKESLDQYK